MRTFFKDALTVERLTKVIGALKEEYTAHGIVYGVILGISPEDVMLSEGNPARSAVLNCEPSSDIIIGDRITFGADTYIVKSIKTPTRLFSVAFKRCIIEKMRS